MWFSPVAGLQARGLSQGTVFSVVLASVIGIVGSAAVTWGCLWPKIREKRLRMAERRLANRTNDILPRYTRRGRSFVRDNVALRTLNTDRMSNADLITYTNNVLGTDTPAPFTPIRDSSTRVNPPPRPATPLNWSAETYHHVLNTAPIVRTRYPTQDFSDAKEYILTVPEPLRRTNTNGHNRVPATTLRRLETEGSSSTDVPSVGKDLPADDDSCLSDSALGAVTLFPTVDSHRLNRRSSLSAIEQELTEMDSSGKDGHGFNASIAAMQRLHTYRSLTGAQPPPKLNRAGTISRPKTPVASLKNLFDQCTNEAVKTPLRQGISHAQRMDVPGSSERGRSSTAPTSVGFTGSSLSLLPTPLQIRSPPIRCTRDDDTIQDGLWDDDIIALSSSSPPDVLSFVDCTNQPFGAGSRPLCFPRSPPEARQLPQDRNGSSTHDSQNRQSIIPENGVLKPQVRFTEVQNVRASSMYSRDTKGYSISRSSTISMFNSKFNLNLPSLSLQPGQPGNKRRSTSNVKEASTKDQGLNSCEALSRAKVDDWKCDINNMRIEKTTPSPFEQKLSKPGSKQEFNFGFHRADSGGDHDATGSTISTDYTANENRDSYASVPRLCIRDSRDLFISNPDQLANQGRSL